MLSGSSQGQLTEYLPVDLLSCRAEPKPQIELLGAVLTRNPQHRYPILPATGGFRAYRLHREAPIAPTLPTGCDVQPPDPAAERIDRTLRIKATHDEAHKFVGIEDEPRPSRLAVRVRLGQRPC